MLTKRIKIINCYFGKVPPMFQLWLQTCIRNKKIDFLLVTDQMVICDSENIQILRISFSDLKSRISEKMPFQVNIEKPYKLCDYKIAYGIIFSDYLKGYDFWGHCDNDMLFGNLENYLSDELLEKYPKILYLGHLSLYKNVDFINQLVIKDNELFDWNKIYSDSHIFGIDEDRGIYQLYLREKIPVYSEKIFFDIDPYSTHMRLDNIVDRRMGKKCNRNYFRQMFVWKNGKVLRYFIKDAKINVEEAAYIHCGKNQIKKCIVSNDDTMLIFSKNCICSLNKEIITNADFNIYNRFSIVNMMIDKLKYVNFKIRRKLSTMRTKYEK